MGRCEIGIRFVFQCRMVGAHVKLDEISKHIDTNGFDFFRYEGSSASLSWFKLSAMVKTTL